MKVRIIADSICTKTNKRLTTFELTYQRFFHQELMTHRVLSRNSSSSRAIPWKKLVAMIIKDPATPIYWGKNQRGMQAKEELSGWRKWLASKIWVGSRWFMVLVTWILSSLGLHKQIINRLLEPWMNITVLVSATEWDNFFNLRKHPDAQPEFNALATEMWNRLQLSVPKKLEPGQFHIPYGDNIDREQKVAIKIATARIARVSYMTHDGKIDYIRDIKLHDELAESKHWSPFEHVAMAMDDLKWSGNFCGWKQYREIVDPDFIRRV